MKYQRPKLDELARPGHQLIGHCYRAGLHYVVKLLFTMLVSLSYLPDRVSSSLSNLRDFAQAVPSSQPRSADAHRIVKCSAHSQASSVPLAARNRRNWAPGGLFNTYQSQLDRAAHYSDLEACIHNLKNYGRAECLRLTDAQLRGLVSTAFDQGSVDLAVSLIHALPEVRPKHFSLLFKECIRRKDLQALNLVMKGREAAGFTADAYSTSARLAILGVLGRGSDAMNALKEAWSDPSCQTVEVCNAAIGAAAVAGDWGAAEMVLELMKATGLSPDIVTYNALIKTAGRAGLMVRVRALHEELKRSGLKPTHLTYTGLFTAAAKNRYEDATWLLRVFREMVLTPNDYVLSAFFSAMSFSNCSSRSQLDTVFAALADARSQGPPNDTVYTALLKLVTRQGIADRAVDVWRAAQQDRIVLSPHLLSALFAACTEGSSPVLVDVALDAYAEMREWWAAQDKSRVPEWFERDVRFAYNALLHFIGDTGELDEALAIFESMKRGGPLPDTVTYNTIISAAGHAGDLNMALQLFGEMAGARLEPTERTFGALLHAFAAVGDAEAARRMFEGLWRTGIAPNAILYTSFIDSLVTAGDTASLETAFSVADEMRSLGLAPTAVTYGCLLLACDKLGDVPRAFALYKQACSEGITPSDQMHDILINACTRSGRLDEALDLVKTVARSHTPLQQTTMDSLVRALSATSISRSLRTMRLMQVMGMAPSPRTFTALVAACARSGDAAESLALYLSIRAQGIEVGGAAGSALIVCLCRSHTDLPAAVGVYKDMLKVAWRPHRGVKGAGRRRGALPTRAHLPDSAALASLAEAHAARGQLREAWRFYWQLRRGAAAGLQDACVTNRRMFEVLIEGNCRSHNLGRALTVFDDWKAASAAWFARVRGDHNINGGGPGGSEGGLALASSSGSHGTVHAVSSGSGGNSQVPGKRQPKLSNVTLAFLEACCRSESALEWRVYDVCSVMRMQKERKLQDGLERPLKPSHHVLGSVQAL